MLRRSKSYGIIGQALTAPTAIELKQRAVTTPFVSDTQRMRSRGKSNTSLSIGTILSKAIDDVMSGPATKTPSPTKAESKQGESVASVIRHDTPMQSSHGSQETITAPAPPPQGLVRSQSTHLDLEAIREGTRCISRGSTTLSSVNQEDVSEFLQSHRWNHNRSTTPDITSFRHRRNQSSLAVPTSTIVERMAAAREENVYSPSIYSRPGSAEENVPDVPNRLDSALRGPEWPLRDEDKGKKTLSPPTSPVLSIRTLHKPLPPTPESLGDPSTTKSPPKKTVKKRRSIFRFLRPGSRKGPGRALRSISSPILLYKAPVRHSGVFDGPADEITVQYELSENPQHRRSVTVSHLAVPQERRGTLVDYERSLSVSGDSRRRASSSQFNSPPPSTLRQVLEDEDDALQRAQSSSRLRRKLSRAHALDEAGKTIMGQALKKHQQEKALFRSESKRRESLVPGAEVQQPLPTFGGSGMWQPASLPNMTVMEEDEEVGPCEAESPKAGVSAAPTTRQPSTRTMSTPGSPTAELASPATPRGIGTSLPSWSRFPSHTREERCASAGRGDAVSTRDWAHLSSPGPQQLSPLSKHSTMKSRKSSTRRVASNLIKSPSRTFSRVVRYYSDLFTRDLSFHGGNRRTSVSASTGYVLHPELEMLPPVTGSEGHRHDHSHLREIEERLFGEHPHSMPATLSKGKAKEDMPSGFRLVSEGTGFRQGSIFAAPSSPSMHSLQRQKTRVEEVAPEGDATPSDEEGPGPMDGADRFAEMYRAEVGAIGERARSESRVRKYPSVTVLDDCKGHKASISLVANCA